jgi:hypothetical protein
MSLFTDDVRGLKDKSPCAVADLDLIYRVVTVVALVGGG